MASRDQILKMVLSGMCLVFSGLLHIVFGTGQIEVHFKKYSDNCNEDFGTNPCDPLFSFCLSRPQQTRSLSVDNCSYASTKESRDEFQDRSYIVLENVTSIGGLPNPWVVQVPMFLEPSVMLVVRCRDADFFQHDHLQTWGMVLTEHIWPSNEQSTWVEYTMSQNSYTMVFKVRMYCDPFYFTPTCDKFCKADNTSTGHYICDQNNGSKICLTGWHGEQCTEDINECALGYCLFGKCVNLPGSYFCICHINYTGSNCTEMKNPCNPNPCQNGGSCSPHSSEYSYSCNCSQEWKGEVCDKRDHCKLEPCMNNGLCTNSENGTDYTCTCVYPYNGSNCEDIEPTISSNDTTGFETTTEFETTSTTMKVSFLTTTMATIEIGGTTTNNTQRPVENMQQISPEDDDEFPLWYIAIIGAALVVIVVAVVILLIRRRRRRKAALTINPPDLPVVSYNGCNLTFENRTHADMSQTNSESERQTRQLPRVPYQPTTPTENEFLNPQKPSFAEMNELGATGGSIDDCSDPKGRSVSDDSAKAAVTLHAQPVSERAKSNLYSNFQSLTDAQKEEGRPDLGPRQEESHYHDILDMDNSMQENHEPFNFDFPVNPVVRVMSSPYDTPPNNASYYSTPPMRSTVPTQPQHK